jgi:hypothetical protein
MQHHQAQIAVTKQTTATTAVTATHATLARMAFTFVTTALAAFVSLFTRTTTFMSPAFGSTVMMTFVVFTHHIAPFSL